MPEHDQLPLHKRLVWVVLLWLVGVGTVAATAYGLRFWIGT